MPKKLSRSVTPRAAGVLLLLAALAAVLASSQLQSARAAAPSPPKKMTGGFVPPRGHASPQVLGSGDLIYHGGPVMTTNKTYAIFWVPSGETMSASYINTINQFFQDVAFDSGLSSNVYASDVQYSGIQYSSTVGGSWTDTAAFPTTGQCTKYGTGATACLTDVQLQAEIDKAISTNGWVKNGTNMFFIFTPKNVESCSGPGSCAFSRYCAYHGVTSSGAIYANQPYGITSISPFVGNCDPGQSPNGNDADATINVTSHEHNEAITDPHLNAWYDAQGFENGDKCAWDFGTITGNYNQTINGHHYILQREYSNDGSHCVQTYNITPPGPPTVTTFSPDNGPVGTTVDVQGTNLGGTTQVTFNGTVANYTINSSTDIHADVPVGATSGLIGVTTPQGSTSSASSFTVTIPGSQPPTISNFSPTSGPVGTNVAITGTNLSTVTSVTFNGLAATTVTFDSDTQIHAVVPTNATTGLINVVNPHGNVNSATNFTVVVVVQKPSISSFTPTAGRRGTVVAINGSNFNGVTSVKLGTTPASFTIISNTQIKATVPAVRVGQYKWLVTSSGGTATSFTYFRVTG